MIQTLQYALAAAVIAFIVRVIMLLIELYKNYKSMRKKYPVSIWKLPSQNLGLMNDEDKAVTKKLYLKYALNVFGGLVVIIGLSTLVIHYSE